MSKCFGFGMLLTVCLAMSYMGYVRANTPTPKWDCRGNWDCRTANPKVQNDANGQACDLSKTPGGLNPGNVPVCDYTGNNLDACIIGGFKPYACPCTLVATGAGSWVNFLGCK